jgi:hypothetical protein
MAAEDIGAAEVPKPREVTIYGIRDKATGEIRYVGQTVSLKHRKASRYAPDVAAWLLVTDWEYVELAKAALDDAVEVEQSKIDELRTSGAALFNKKPAYRSIALSVAPPGPGRSRFQRFSLRPTEDGQLEAWKAAAGRAGMNISDWMRESLNEASGWKMKHGGGNGDD